MVFPYTVRLTCAASGHKTPIVDPSRTHSAPPPRPPCLTTTNTACAQPRVAEYAPLTQEKPSWKEYGMGSQKKTSEMQEVQKTDSTPKLLKELKITSAESAGGILKMLHMFVSLCLWGDNFSSRGKNNLPSFDLMQQN